MTLLVVCLAGCLGACVTYRSAPIDNAYLEGALATPDSTTLRVAASRLDHPYLHPIDFDASNGLNSNEVAVLAVIANPSLRATRASKRIGSAQLIAAGVLPNPEFSVSIEYPLNDTTGATTAYGMGLSLDIRSLFLRNVQRNSARAEMDQINLDVAWQEWQIAQASKLKLYDVVFLSQLENAAKRQEEALRSNLQVLSDARRQNLVQETERVAAETAYLEVRLARLELSAQLDTTRLGLAHLLGLSSTATVSIESTGIPYNFRDIETTTRAPTAEVLRSGPLTLAPNRTPDIANLAIPRLPPLDELLADLEHRRIDLVALRFGYDSQDSKLRAAILGQFPTIVVGLNRATNDARLLTVGPGVSIGLPVFDRNQGEIAVEDATREMLRMEYAARVYDARNEVATLYALHNQLREQLDAAIALAHSQNALAQTYGAALNAGNIDVLTYFAAQTSFISADMSVIQLRQSLAGIIVALETTVGEMFTDYIPVQ